MNRRPGGSTVDGGSALTPSFPLPRAAAGREHQREPGHQQRDRSTLDGLGSPPRAEVAVCTALYHAYGCQRGRDIPFTEGAGPTAGDRVRSRRPFNPAKRSRPRWRPPPYPLTMVNSLVGTAKDLVGRNQGRVLLLDRTGPSIVAGAQFWRRRSGPAWVLPLGALSVRYASGELWITNSPSILTPPAISSVEPSGSPTDIELFVRAGVNS